MFINSVTSEAEVAGVLTRDGGVERLLLTIVLSLRYHALTIMPLGVSKALGDFVCWAVLLLV